MAAGRKDDRRRFTRLPFDGAARLGDGDRTWLCELIDISLKGALVRHPADLPVSVGTTYTMQVILGAGAVVIALQAAAVHIGDGCTGFVFEQTDILSFSRLRRLLELNLGDPDLMDRELSALTRCHDSQGPVEE